MNEVDKIGAILFILGSLGFFSILGYGVYMAFGWLGVIIYASIILMIILMIIGGGIICSD